MRVLILSLFMLVSPGLFAEIVVEGATFKPIKLAVPKAKTIEQELISTKLGDELIEIIRNDLSWASVFQVLDPRSFIANLDKEGLKKSTIDIENWKQVGAQGLVKSEVRVAGNQLSVEIGVHWLEGLKASHQETFSGNTDHIKQIAHRVSDAILTFFTGESGIFNSQIVVSKTFPQGKKIVLVDVDGENEKIVTKDNGIHILPTFAPEGETILYTAYRDNNANLMRVNLDGTNQTTLCSRPDLNTGAQVSPDRTQIAFTNITKGGSEIYLADRNGKNQTRITDSLGINISPSFSPDGTKITFVSSRSGNPQIYLMSSDGKNPKRLTFQGKYNQTPRFSPRGDYIAFTGRDENKKFDIFLLQLSTGKITRVTQDQGNNEDPWFSPNGRLLVFTSTRHGSRDLYISSLDGNMQRRVTKGGEYWTPSWGPST